MLDLKKGAPIIIRSQELWADFLDVLTEVFLDLQTQIEDKSKYLDFDLYTDRNEILAVSRSFGYNPNLILHSDLDYLKKEAKSIYYKIINKGTYNYYNYVFKLIPNDGQVYIFFKDYLKLVRAIDTTTTFSNLNTHDLTTPFTGVQSVLHFDDYTDDAIELDYTTLYYLDSAVAWFLDQDIIVKPTNHIAVEYVVDSLITEDGTDYILTDDYFDFLAVSVNYGRKVTDVPHVGCQISFIMSENGYFDSFHTTQPSYSIPTLKSSSSITQFYKELNPAELIYLDDGYTLDEETTWYLNNDEQVIVNNEDSELFKYLKVGTGTQGFYSKFVTGLKKQLTIHLPMNDPSGTTVTDLSGNDFNGVVSGDFTHIAGSAGKTIRLNGVNTEISVSNLSIVYDEATYCFWMKGDQFGQLVNNARILYHNGMLNVYYDKILQRIVATLIGSLASVTLTYDYNINNQELFVLLEIDKDNNRFRMYVNDDLKDTEDTSSIGVWNTNNDFLIGSQDGSNFFRGYIDEVRIYDKLLTTTQKTYLYTSKVGGLNQLANEVYSEELSTNQLYEGSQFKAIVGSVPANTTKYVLATGDGATQAFSGTLEYANIQPKSFIIEYTSQPNTYTTTSDEDGNIVGTRIGGTINYTTGAYSFYTYKDYSQVNELVSAVSISTITAGTSYTNVQAGTFKIYYWIGSTQYVGSDDGAGNITGTGISVGTLNYTNGAYSITFTGATDVGKTIVCDYTYRLESTPDSDTAITVQFKTSTAIELTEAGLFDVDGNMTAYATFPPVQFKDIYNHLSVQFFIRKS